MSIDWRPAIWVVAFLSLAAMVNACGGSGGGGGDDDEDGDILTGCGIDRGHETGQWLQRSVNAADTETTYFVRLPPDYDPSRAYPVVYQFHGCSDDREINNVPVGDESGNNASYVRGRAIEPCWDESQSPGQF